MSPELRPSSGTDNEWTALPVLLMLSVPPSAGSVIINGLNLNSVSVTSTLTGAEAEAPDAELSRSPNIANARAVIATTNANQPRTDLSSFAMRAIVIDDWHGT